MIKQNDDLQTCESQRPLGAGSIKLLYGLCKLSVLRVVMILGGWFINIQTVYNIFENLNHVPNTFQDVRNAFLG